MINQSLLKSAKRKIVTRSFCLRSELLMRNAIKYLLICIMSQNKHYYWFYENFLRLSSYINAQWK